MRRWGAERGAARAELGLSGAALIDAGLAGAAPFRGNRHADPYAAPHIDHHDAAHLGATLDRELLRLELGGVASRGGIVNFHELVHVLTRARCDDELRERVLETLAVAAEEIGEDGLAKAMEARSAVECLRAAADLFEYSRTRYMPAAAGYSAYKQSHSNRARDSARFRHLRASRGATRRWLYAHQRNSLDRVLDLLIPWPASQLLTSERRALLWHLVQGLESRWLAGDKRSASRNAAPA